MRGLKETIGGNTYNKAGVKSDGIRNNVRTVSGSLLDSFPAPIALTEEELEEKLRQELRVEAMKTMIPIIIGEKNYIILMLARIISTKDIASYMGISDDAIRSRLKKSRKKIAMMSEMVDSDIHMRIEDIKYDILYSRVSDEVKEEDFDLELEIKKYEENLRSSI